MQEDCPWNTFKNTVNSTITWKKTFPQYLSVIHAKCEDLETRKVLTQNLFEEECEGVPHVELWRQFQSALGVPKDEQSVAPLLPETSSTIATIKNVCSERSVEEGIAAMFAYEAMLPEVSRRKIDGLKRHYNIEDAHAIQFFLTHMEADAKHSNAWIDLLKERQDVDPEKLKAAVSDTCHALNGFLDGVMTAYVPVAC